MVTLLTDPIAMQNNSSTCHPLVPGIYVPIVTFFREETEDLDFPTLRKHITCLTKSGIAGIVVQGSIGEAVHLSHTERQIVTSVAREHVNAAGFEHMPVIVGCGAQSTRETVEFCLEAKLAGGSHALVLPPSYYQTLYDRASILHFFTDVADQSPIPIIIYNYPGATRGYDLDSDEIIELSRHPNIVGVKLTCGNTGKLNRVVGATQARTHTWEGSGFMCMGGSVDFTTQMLIGGGSGIIGGLANFAPKACIEVFNLWKAGKFDEATRVQAVVARGDWAATKKGIVGMKSAMQTYLGYGGYCRKPVTRPTQVEERRYADQFAELYALEQSL